ncbi:MAG: allophanate hydrolase [Methylocystis sp.]|nr:MAG: allophanate hydrolase [Methylocystis sp.]
MQYESPRFLDQGEAALVVEFGDAVDAGINARVLALDRALQRDAPPGVRETTPTYRSLLVHYEPLQISRGDLVAWIESVIARSAGDEAIPDGARWTLPCCYDPAIAEDIREAASLLNMTPGELAARHAGADYRAYMYGFAPGWCYLGGLPPALAIPRRLTPRGPTPENAVLIGGGLSLVATNSMPTGWYVVGRTPEWLFSLTREPPFLVSPGDVVRFAPVDATTFAALEARAAKGEIVARCESCE